MGRRKKKNDHAQARSGSGIDPAEVLRLFRKIGKPLTLAEITRGLKRKKQDKEAIRRALESLTSQGRLIRTKAAWGLLDKMNLVTGRLQVTRSGAGFVLPEDTRRKDVYIDPRDMEDAWHGDRVVAAVSRERKRGSHEGRIVRVLERARQVLPSKVVRRAGQGAWLCRPSDPRLGFGIMAEPDPKLEGEPSPGEIVLVAPGKRLEPYLWEGVIKDRLGAEESLVVQEAMVKVNHQIPTDFPDDALDQALALPEAPSQTDGAGRRDLRKLGLVTIDGADARDFDDAIHVAKRGAGWRLTVAIADVSHYVRPGSPLDRAAVRRGNSYYFPLSVEPMFPTRLSNGLCSLNPGVDRLCMVVVIDFDGRGDPHEAEYFPALMNSAARLTYAQVRDALVPGFEQGREQARASMTPKVLSMLEEAMRLAEQLRRRRTARGSLDFELPEAKVVADDQGRVLDVRPAELSLANKLIEECMIAANEAVARFLEGGPTGCMFRVHPEPDGDKLEALFHLLARSGVDFVPPSEPDPRALQELIAKVRGGRMEFLVNRLLLRSMKQAKYNPDNEGHFGLASEAYCHFTSPIRRYADLIVHRQLKHALGQADQSVPGTKKLYDLAGQLNSCERVSVEAEREMDKRAAILHLMDKQGQSFTGVISGLSDQGFWVELAEVMAEGMVRLSGLDDDYYTYWRDEERIVGTRTGKNFVMGQAVEVVLESVSLDRLEVDLSLTGSGPARVGLSGEPDEAEVSSGPPGYRPAPRPGRPKAGSRKPGAKKSGPRKKYGPKKSSKKR